MGKSRHGLNIKQQALPMAVKSLFSAAVSLHWGGFSSSHKVQSLSWHQQYKSSHRAVLLICLAAQDAGQPLVMGPVWDNVSDLYSQGRHVILGCLKVWN